MGGPPKKPEGWTDEMWTARQRETPIHKAFSTDDQFKQDWDKGATTWQKWKAANPGGDPYLAFGTGALVNEGRGADAPPLPDPDAEAKEKNFTGAVAPDLTDKAVQDARKRQMLRIGGGRKSTFLTGPAGLEGASPMGRKTALGGY